jgi:hypothetical protein
LWCETRVEGFVWPIKRNWNGCLMNLCFYTSQKGKHKKRQLQAPKWFNIIILFSLNPYLFTKAWSFTSLLFACHWVTYKMPWNQKHKNFKLVLFCSRPSHGKEKRKFSQPFMMLRSSIESWKGFFFPLYDSWLLLQLIG